MGVSLKQTTKELILVQDDVRSMKTVKALLETVGGGFGRLMGD